MLQRIFLSLKPSAKYACVNLHVHSNSISNIYRSVIYFRLTVNKQYNAIVQGGWQVCRKKKLRVTAHSRNFIKSCHRILRIPACQPRAATDLYSIQLFLLLLQLVNIKYQPTHAGFILVERIANQSTSVRLAAFDWLRLPFFSSSAVGWSRCVPVWHVPSQIFSGVKLDFPSS